jgi:hypothetical protein
MNNDRFRADTCLGGAMFVGRDAPLFLATIIIIAASLSAETQAGAGPAGIRPAGEAQVTDRTRQRFLTPLDGSLFLPPNDPRVRRACRDNDSNTECPKFLRYGNDVAGSGPFIPPSFKADVPHLLVTFTLRDVAHVPIAGDGVGSDHVTFRFFLDSSISSAEVPTEWSGYGVGGFLPNTTENFNVIMWQAIIYSGCVTPPPVIPLVFRNEIGASPEGDGLFEAADNTSLVPTGFWNVQYAVRVTDSARNISDYRVRGFVSVVCIGSDSDFPD